MKNDRDGVIRAEYQSSFSGSLNGSFNRFSIYNLNLID